MIPLRALSMGLIVSGIIHSNWKLAAFGFVIRWLIQDLAFMSSKKHD